MELKKHKLPRNRQWSDVLSKHLCKEHIHEFDKWWNPELFNWKDASNTLAELCHEYFDTWWDPERFNWEDASSILAEYCHIHFHKWWDPNKFNWKKASSALARYYHKFFDTWWDPERFNWGYSWVLTTYCSNYFHKWWDPEKFDMDIVLPDLIQYCADYLSIWWDPTKFTISDREARLLGTYAYRYANIWLIDVVNQRPAIKRVMSKLNKNIITKLRMQIALGVKHNGTKET